MEQLEPRLLLSVSFQDPTTYLFEGSEPDSLVIEDFDRDGRNDIAFADWGNSVVRLLRGTGGGAFSSLPTVSAGTLPIGVATADFNGDAKPDLAVTTCDDESGSGGRVIVFLGRGDGTFIHSNEYVTGALPNSIAVGDFDQDNKADLAVTNLRDSTVSVLIGKGDGTFKTATNFVLGSPRPVYVGVGDCNGDGREDLAVLSWGVTGNLDVLLGQPDGNFSAAYTFDAGDRPQGQLAVGDFNGDGRSDVAVPALYGNTIKVYLGHPTNILSLNHTYQNAFRADALAAIDMDGDGKLDLVVGGGSTLSVRKGFGDGTFEPFSGTGDDWIDLPDIHENIALGDLDGTGQPDVALTHYAYDLPNGGLSILLNAAPGDSVSPGRVTNAGFMSGNRQVGLSWVTPTDLDLETILIVRRSGQAPIAGPADHTRYRAGDSIGGGTVIYNQLGTRLVDKAVSNGVMYYYDIWASDTSMNYSLISASGNVRPEATPILTETDKVVASDSDEWDFFGRSVSISGDYAIAGAPWHNRNGGQSGSAYIFKPNGSDWVEEFQLFPATPKSDAWFGSAVAISGDYAVVGAYGEDLMTHTGGVVYVFHREGSAWRQQARLTKSDSANAAMFGQTVAIDGDCIIVGTGMNEAAYVFSRSGTNWTEQAKLVASDLEWGCGFGSNVAISGNYAFVGAPGDDGGGACSGSVYVFNRVGANWTKQTKLFAPDPGRSGAFGTDVSISGDYAVVGGDAAYIFHRSGTDWLWEKTLVGDTTFGESVSISGDNVVVGQSGGSSGVGAAYVYHRDGANWSLRETLTASDTTPGASFGETVSVSGDHIIVGADDDDAEGRGSGAAYIFRDPNAPPPIADRTPPGNITGLHALGGDGQVDLNWTKPSDSDLSGVVIVRRAGSAPATGPANGVSYSVGSSIGGGTVIYNADGASYQDTNVTNGTTYYYEAWAYDTSLNYSRSHSPTASATPAAAPPQVVLVVPGILGTMPTDHWASWLVFGDSGVAPENLALDPIQHTYDDLLASFRKAGYNDTPGELRTLWGASYDWRLEIAPEDGSNDGRMRLSGVNPNDDEYEYGIEYIDYWVEQARDDWVDYGYLAEDFSVDIVAHSMGGLVTRAYIQSDLYDSGDIDQFLMLGTPNHGAVDAYQYREWINGALNFALDKAIGFVAAGLSATGIGAPLGMALLAGAAATDIGLIEMYSPSITNLLPTFDFISNVWPHKWVHGVDDNVFLADLNSNIGAYYGSGGVDAKIFYGTGVDTDYELYHPLGLSLLNLVSFDGGAAGSGDGTVLASSAKVGGITSEALAGVEHGKLGGALQSVQREIFEFLGVDVSGGFAYETGRYRSLMDAVTGKIKSIVGLTDPVDGLITDSQGRSVGYTEATGEVNEIPGAWYSGDGEYELTIIPAPSDGAYDIEYQGLDQEFVGALMLLENGGATTRSQSGMLASGNTTADMITGVDATGPVILNDPPVSSMVREKMSDIHLRFSEMLDPGSASDPGNYALYGPGGEVTFSSVAYDESSLVVTLTVQDSPLPDGQYQLIVNGTSSLRDLANNRLDGDQDGVPGGDYQISFEVEQGMEIIIGDNQAKSVAYVDGDGTSTTVALKVGTAALVFTGDNLQQTAGRSGVIVSGDNVELAEITLSDTTDRSSLTFKTTKSRMPGDDGLATVGVITGGTPLGMLSAKTIDLVGAGIDLSGSGYIGSVQLHDVRNGADIRLPGLGATRGVTITTGVLHPDTDIVLGSYLKSLTATEWLGGSLVAPWVSSISVKGDSRSGVSGDFDADVTLTGADAKGVALDKFTVAGTIIDATITANNGSIGTVSAGQWDSGLLSALWVKSLTTKGRKANVRSGITALNGDFGADLILTGADSKGVSLGSAAIKGEIACVWDIEGATGAIKASTT
ncbi:MAG: hypothetical protein HN350_00400, partial [Phycisphaerales bacterium]|nr:hypothetical protein [Phycisphaerales bacterium]